MSDFVAPSLGSIDAPRAIPFYFGPEGRKCFGWLHRPASDKATNLGVVLCNPLGYDVMCAHRSYRYIATRLAAEGIATVRFDYPSGGDSPGNVDDPDRVAAWISSIRDACSEIKRHAGVTRLVLFGLRAGGTLAAEAARGIPDLVGFAAWSPFVSGTLLIRELRALAGMTSQAEGGTSSIIRADGGLHVAGFALSLQTVDDLQKISLTKLAEPPASCCLLMARDDLPSDSRLSKHWSAVGSRVLSVTVPGYAQMMRDAFESSLPLEAVETLTDWVKNLRTPFETHVEVTDLANQRARVPAAPGVLEQAEWFGPGLELSGISSRPESGTPKRTAILFGTVGANHRIGSNRLHVEIGRDLARLGYLSLRMDIGGTGDSGQVCERERFWEYKRDTHLDIVEGVEWLLRQPRVEAVVLWGICSGAYMCYHAALASESVSGALLFNLQLFRWREQEVKENLARGRVKSFAFYARKAVEIPTWRRFLAGSIDVRSIAGGIAARATKRIKVGLHQMVFGSSGAGLPRHQIAQLSKRGCRLSFVCTPEDTGLHEIRIHLGANASLVSHLPGVEYVEVGQDTGADHTFTAAAAQHWVKSWTQAQILKYFS
ncbi:acetyl esterase/lipase [Panacagrimonas perspica]|uniref:Acetyl esterase/lipase n=1 Tax=Panacagrimonas perspica TaxID=381431 RepID=A0A4S3KA86_9GAMM|nr:alpha/beta hydrolase [Panacagrimonas perspica]TDU32297.1 acetyl esterase/lipase [Panacagrimonas perspica]THD05240.1 hypothetical protein B1810_00325 [Panacagrimonas perspica]